MRYVLFITVLASGYLTTSSGEANIAPGASLARSPDSVQSLSPSIPAGSAEVFSTGLTCTPPPGCRCVGHTFMCM
jgi:hypothetical protein